MSSERRKFTLDKAAWRENRKLKRHPELKGIWLDVLLELDDQAEQGIYRGPLANLAKDAEVPLGMLKKLTNPNIDTLKGAILKGADEGMTCEAYNHTNRYGEKIILVEAQPGPLWYSSRIVRDAHLAAEAAKHGRSGGRIRRQALLGSSAVKHTDVSTESSGSDGRTLTTTLKGVDKGVFQRGSPPASSPPQTPPLTPPTSTPPFAAQTGAARSDQRKSGGRSKKPITHATEFRQLTDFWCETHALFHGGEKYIFAAGDGPMISSFWGVVGYDLERGKTCILAYMNDRHPHYEGHPMNLFKRDMRKFIARTAKGSHNGNSATDTGIGAFTGSRRSLPEVATG